MTLLGSARVLPSAHSPGGPANVPRTVGLTYGHSSQEGVKQNLLGQEMEAVAPPLGLVMGHSGETEAKEKTLKVPEAFLGHIPLPL